VVSFAPYRRGGVTESRLHSPQHDQLVSLVIPVIRRPGAGAHVVTRPYAMAIASLCTLSILL